MRALKKLKEEKLIFFDIETAPIHPELELDTPTFDSWAYKVNKDGAKTDKEVIDSFSQEAGLYPEFAKIVTIVVGKIVKGKIVLVTLDDENEVDILNKFNRLVSRNSDSTLVGFVNKGFDTPFVAKRMLINGIEFDEALDSSGLKPWEVEEVDLSEIWKLTSFNRASLINIATALGLPSPKDDINGSDVGRVYWEEPNGLSRIAKYCRQDVITTINIFKKMRFEDVLEVDTDASNIEPEPSPVMQSLLEGAPYDAKTKKYLIAELALMDEGQREKAFIMLEAVVSSARGKKTKLTKAHVRTLRKEFDE